MASYRKRNGSWEYRIRVKDPYTNKYREITKSGFKRRTDAVYAADHLDILKYEGFIEKSDNPLLSTYMEDWFNTAKSRYAFNTKITKGQSVNRIKKELANIRIKQVNYKIVQHYLDELDKVNYSRSVIEHDYTLINQTMTQALRDGYIYRDPLLGVKIPKGKPAKAPRFWTVADLDQFIIAQKHRIDVLGEVSHGNVNQYYAIRDLALITTLAGCGARIGELCGLTLNNYDSKNHVLELHQQLVSNSKEGLADEYVRTSTMKTKASYREVPMPEASWMALDNWIKVRTDYIQLFHHKTDDGSIFPSSQSDRPIIPNTVRQQFKRLCARHGLPIINIHGLRHTYASFLQQAGVSTKRAQILMGHGRLSTTADIYTHVTVNDKIDAVKQLDDLLERKLTNELQINHESNKKSPE
ncbi:tyrosine-type recombinase/integrase [Paucilactobacillus nenjiangensis]|uniref:tyrosine-type recombinase/integrase n=1 Tax=Paucilactobacillus nenjiangensis TaxID=1296540 RepID=UPI003BB7FF90